MNTTLAPGPKNGVHFSPLALSLARVAWDTFPRELRELREQLPPPGKKALDDRLRDLGGVPAAGGLFRREIAEFRTLTDFDNPEQARFWSVLAEAEPQRAVRQLRYALEGATPGEKLAFGGEARREVIWHLPKLAWDRETFRDAVVCLAELSVAENELWANNATGEFVGRFQIYLSGTELPYLERLPILDDVWEKGEAYHKIVLRALGKAAEIHSTRLGGAEDRGRGPAGPEWRPSPENAHASRIAALERLEVCIAETEPALADEVLETLRRVIWPLNRHGYDNQLESLAKAAVTRFPQLREPLRRELNRHLAHADWAREHDKEEWLPGFIERIHEALVDSSLNGRLRQHVGPAHWDKRRDEESLIKLARELLDNPDALLAQLEWLTSGEAESAIELGMKLGGEDTAETLFGLLTTTEGVGFDLRLHAGYVLALARRKNDMWLNDLLGRIMNMPPRGGALACDILWRVAPSDDRARLAARLIGSPGLEPGHMRSFAHGQWCDNLGESAFSELIEAIAGTDSPDGARAALDMLAFRFHSKKILPSPLRDIAVMLVTCSDVFPKCSGSQIEWHELAMAAAEHDPRAVARFIFAVQSEPESHFFLKHHRLAVEVLIRCAEVAPELIWDEFVNVMESGKWARLCIGFPEHFLPTLPNGPILTWIADAHKDRAAIIAHFLSPDFNSDNDLDSQLVNLYGYDKGRRRNKFTSLERERRCSSMQAMRDGAGA